MGEALLFRYVMENDIEFVLEFREDESGKSFTDIFFCDIEGFAIFAKGYGPGFFQGHISFLNLNFKSGIKSNRHRIRKRIITIVFRGEIEYLYGFFVRVHDPIFFYSGRTILEQFYHVIHFSAGRTDNLHDPVWRTMAAFFIQLAFITDHRNIRFDIVAVSSLR